MIWIFLLAILVVGATVFISSLYVVKQQSVAIIERFGRYQKISNSGIHVRAPFGIDKIAARVQLRLLQSEIVVETKTQDKAILELQKQFSNTLPNFTKNELEEYKNSIINVKFWHGTGGFEYDSSRNITPIFDNILKNGLKTQQDDYLIIYSKKLSMKSISLVNKRIIARCYADNHNFKNPKTFRFGDSIFWIVRHYTKMYILAYTILAPRSLVNILSWRKKNKINSKKSWSGKVNKSCKNTWESFEKYSDIRENFPVILGIKKTKQNCEITKNI